MVLVEAPNSQFFLYWKLTQPPVEYEYLQDYRQLDEYHGEVIVLNGGSLDPYMRNKVRLLEVAGQLTVSRREV